VRTGATITPLRLLRAAAVSGTVALVINLAIVGTAPLLGASLTLLAPDDTAPRPLHLPDMIPESFAVSAAAALVLYCLARLSRRPWPLFVGAVMIITSLWTTGPLSHGADAATKIALSMTHLVIAASVLYSNYLLVIRPGKRSGP
jgi:hypothetical protein